MSYLQKRDFKQFVKHYLVKEVDLSDIDQSFEECWT